MSTNTYVELDKKTVTTAVATVEFTSFSQGYTDLVLVMKTIGTVNGGDVQIQFNGDTGSNYSFTNIYGRATGTAASFRETNGTSIWLDNFAELDTGVSNRIVSIQNYSNTATNKTVICRAVNAARGTDANIGLWRSNSAITSFLVKVTNSNTFATNTTFSLYGIKAEPQISTAKATGGTIYYAADGYTYHKFTSSGTFTPSQALTADLLVVGAGGGGGELGGGGGAGGLLLQSGRSLSSGVGYTVTINGGGAGAVGYGNQGGAGGNAVFDTSTAIGGGGGGGGAGGNGGSGGGAGSTTAGSSTQGNSGGATGYGNAGGAYTSGAGRGGGGGAGGVGGGGFTRNYGHDGGIGLTNSLINAMGGATLAGQQVGSNFYFAGGGGGSGDSGGINQDSIGGFGGGGAGKGKVASTGVAGTANTGGGGGGGGHNSGATYPGGAGGSGIVIVRYLG
jgi:hypothetical protein